MSNARFLLRLAVELSALLRRPSQLVRDQVATNDGDNDGPERDNLSYQKTNQRNKTTSETGKATIAMVSKKYFIERWCKLISGEVLKYSVPLGKAWG